MMMVMIGLQFNGNVNGFHNGFRMEVSMVLDWNVDTNPKLSQNEKNKNKSN